MLTVAVSPNAVSEGKIYMDTSPDSGRIIEKAAGITKIAVNNITIDILLVENLHKSGPLGTLNES